MSKPGNGKLPSLEELVTDYQQNYGPERRKTCLVCSSANRELIEILMRGGGGGPSISDFLNKRLGERISQAVLSRHKQQHLDAGQDR